MSQDISAPMGGGYTAPEPKIYPLEFINVIGSAKTENDTQKDASEKPNGAIKGPDPAEVKKQLFWLSQTAAQTGTTWFQSFLGLGLLDLYQYQHELAGIGELLYDDQKYGVDGIEAKLSDPVLCLKLRNTLREYYQAIQALQAILEIPELQIDLWGEASQDVSTRVGNSVGYSFGTWLDLRNPAPPVDRIRSYLQKKMPFTSVLDANDAMLEDYLEYAKADPVERQKYNYPGLDNLAMNYGRGPLVSRARTQGRHESSRVNILGRLIVALVGGIFFLAPLIIMTFVKSHDHRLIVVSIAVFLFSTAIAFLSESSNQELIGATAAYTAVLVVYVGTAN